MKCDKLNAMFYVNQPTTIGKSKALKFDARLTETLFKKKGGSQNIAITEKLLQEQWNWNNTSLTLKPHNSCLHLTVLLPRVLTPGHSDHCH